MKTSRRDFLKASIGALGSLLFISKLPKVTEPKALASEVQIPRPQYPVSGIWAGSPMGFNEMPEWLTSACGVGFISKDNAEKILRLEE